MYPLEARAEEAIELYQRKNKINTFDFKGFSQNEQAKNQKRIETLRETMATSVPLDTEESNS